MAPPSAFSPGLDAYFFKELRERQIIQLAGTGSGDFLSARIGSGGRGSREGSRAGLIQRGMKNQGGRWWRGSGPVGFAGERWRGWGKLVGRRHG